MFSVIASIISSALGLVLNKARTTTADKLKGGDITDEKLRDLIDVDLNNIQKKIDGLARKDLLASYCFFKEGVVTLNLALKEAKEQISKDEAGCVHNDRSETTTTSGSESGILNEAIALSTAIQKLSNTSNDRLISAEKRFCEARREATQAFCNEALSLADRIMAAKLRVVSKILECLQDTKTAAACCMLFLGELNNLPAIGETFSTYFKGGIKSKVYKTSRLENVKSVLSLNLAVSEFVAKFSGELPDLKNWPRIHLPRTILQVLRRRRETIHPLFLDIDVLKEILEQQKLQPPENQVISKDKINLRCCGINSKSQLLYNCGNSITILGRSGYTKTFCELQQATANLKGNDQKVEALAVDRDDNVYVIICFKDRTTSRYVCVLFVFDSSGNEQYQRVLDFLEEDEYRSYGAYEVLDEHYKFHLEFNCVVNNDGDILFHLSGRNYICVCDSNGNIKARLSPFFLDRVNSSFEGIRLQCVTNQNDIVMRSTKNVFVFTKEGKLKRAIRNAAEEDREPTLGGYPECEFVEQITYNYATSKIDVPVSNSQVGGTNDRCNILSYSAENNFIEVCDCLYLPFRSLCYLWLGRFCSHPAGPAVLINRRSFYNTSEDKIVFM